MQDKSGVLPTAWISFTINDYKLIPHAINNVEESDRSVKPKTVNIVYRVRGEVLKYSKIQFVLSKIIDQILHSEIQDTNKCFLKEGLRHKLKSRGEGAKLFYQ